MATTLASKMIQETGFDDISLHSDSVSSDGSYDFAEGNISDMAEDRMKAQQGASPNKLNTSRIPANSPRNNSEGDESKTWGQSWFSSSLFQRAKNVATNTSATVPLSKEERHAKEREHEKWLQESQMMTRDSDFESVASNDSMISLNVHVETTDNETDLTQVKITTEEAPEQQLDDSFCIDAQLHKIRSELEEHCGKMLQLIEDAPSPADIRSSCLINRQLRGYSRSIAAIFGDDILSLKNAVQACSKKYAELRTLIAIERTSAKNEKSGLQERLRQAMAYHETAFQKKEADARQGLTELTEAPGLENLQERRAEKAESNVTAALQECTRETRRCVKGLEQKHEEAMSALKQKHAEAMQSKILRLTAYNNSEVESKDKVIQKLIDDDAEYAAMLEKKHQEAIEALEQGHEEAMLIVGEEFDTKMEELREQNKVEVESLGKINRELVDKRAEYIRLSQEHDEAIRNTKAEYEARIAQKDQERMEYTEVVEKAQQTYDNYVAELIKKHDRDLQRTKDKAQSEFYVKLNKTICDTMAHYESLIDGKNLRIEELKSLNNYHESLLSEKYNKINKLNAMEKKYKQQVQEQYLTSAEQQLRETQNESQLKVLFTENKKLKQTVDLAQSQIVEQGREMADLRAKAKKTEGFGNSEFDQGKSQASQAAGLSQISSLNVKLFAARCKAESYRKEKEAADLRIQFMQKELESTKQQQMGTTTTKLEENVPFLMSHNHGLTQQKLQADGAAKLVQKGLGKTQQKTEFLTVDLQDWIIKNQLCEANLVQATAQIQQLKGELSNLKTKVASQQSGVTVNKPLAETAAKTAATILAVQQIASQANGDKKVQTESDMELLDSRRKVVELSTINDALSHELELYKASNHGQENRKLKEQLNASEAQVRDYKGILYTVQNAIPNKEAQIKKKFDQYETKVESLKAEAEKANSRGSELENALNEAANENYESQAKLTELEALYSVGQKEAADMHDMIVDFTIRLCEVKDEIDSITGVINTYADGVISGEYPDLQGEWDYIMDEMDKVLQEPYNLLGHFIEKLNEHCEMEVDDSSEEINKARAYVGESAKKIESLESLVEKMATERKIRIENIKELRRSIEFIMEDNCKMNVTTIQTIKERDESAKKYKDMEIMLKAMESKTAAEKN